MSASYALAIQNLRDCVTVNAEEGRQLSHLRSFSVVAHELPDFVRAQVVLDLSGGSNSALFRSRGVHFEEYPDAFPLVTGVRITSQHLH
jgi:hypothetical protein